MAIGERIRFLRKLNGLKQRDLGVSVGFDEKSADIRIAQYENGKRTPKAELINDISSALGVSPRALNVPDIDSDYGLIHTLFALEDIYGLTIEKEEGKTVLSFDNGKGKNTSDLFEMLSAWFDKKSELDSGDITKEEYDRWRYNYPNRPETPTAIKAPKPAPRAASKSSSDSKAEEKSSARTIDDILADIKANLQIMKNEQN